MQPLMKIPKTVAHDPAIMQTLQVLSVVVAVGEGRGYEEVIVEFFVRILTVVEGLEVPGLVVRTE